MVHLENYITTLTKELEGYNDEYIDIYKSIYHNKIRSILSTFHAKLISLFKSMNSRLPSGEYGSRFLADPSRELIYVIDRIEGLQRLLKNTEHSFSLDDTYKGIIEKCKGFLNERGGSAIPPGMEKIELYYTTPIFIKDNVVSINRENGAQTFNLALIGEGSYAQVFKYKDDHYQRSFVIKRARRDLNEKELARFKQEYQIMKDFRSPYIVEVYGYNQINNEFTIEFMDYTLCDYIEKHRNELTVVLRKGICHQIAKAFTYIHSKKIFHRDISPTNILIKEYDDVAVVKIADFGLVKIPENKLTSVHTELKGSFNDPSLRTDGFNTYNMEHEIYAITLMFCFVMEGTTNVGNIKNSKLVAFAQKGINSNKSLRFATISELWNSFNTIY
jgi:serine/threonine-protein kinase